MNGRWQWGVAVVLTLAMAGTVGAAETAPPGAPATGQRLYEQRCAICHAAPGVGFLVLGQRMAPEQADLARRGRVPAALVRGVARHGLGLMPPFSKVALSAAELDAVADYLARPTAEGQP